MSEKTKLNSYRQSRVRQAERLADIIRLISESGPMSRRQLAQALDVESNSVTAAVLIGIKQGVLVELIQTVFDSETQRQQSLLALTANVNPLAVKRKKSAKEELTEARRRLKTVGDLLKFIIQRDASVAALVEEFKKAGAK